MNSATRPDPLEKRQVNWWSRSALALGVLSVIVFGIFGFLTATGPGLTVAEKLVSNIASNDSRGIQINGIRNVWTGKTTVEEIILSDSDGVYANIQNVSADWSMTALLGRTLNAEAITISKVELLRQPKPEEDSQPAEGLPLNINIGEFRLEELKLSPVIANTEARLSLSGKIDIDASLKRASTNLNVLRIGREADVLKFLLDFDQGAEKLNVNLDYSEAKDGLLSNLAELPGKPELAVKINANGSFSDLNMSAEAQSSSDRVLDIKGTLVEEGANRRLVIAGNGTPSRLMPPALRSLISGTMNIAIDVEQSTDGSLTINEANVNTDKFYAVSTGILNPDGENDLSGGITAKSGAISFPEEIIPGLDALVLKSIAFDVKGPFEKSKVEASIVVPQVMTSGFVFNNTSAFWTSPDFNFYEYTGSYQLAAETGSIRSSNDNLNKILTLPTYLEVKGKLTPSEVSWTSLAIENTALTVSSDGQFDRMAQVLNAKAFAKIRTASLPAGLQKLSDDGVTLSANIQANLPESADISNVSINGSNIAVAGNMGIDKDTLRGAIRLNLNDVSAINEKAAGKLDGMLDISGTPTLPEILLKLTSEVIQVEQHKLTDFVLEASGIASIDNPDMKVEIDGSIDDLPLTGGARILVVDGVRRIDAIELKNADNLVQGRIDLDHNNNPDGRINFDFPDLGTLSALFLQPVEGSLAGNIQLTSQNNKPSVRVQAKSPSIVRESLIVEKLDAAIQIEDYLNAPVISGSIDLVSLRAGDTLIGRTDVQLASEDEWTKFEVQTNVNQEIPISTAGSVKLADGATLIRLDKANSKLQGIPLSLAAPTELKIREGTVRTESTRVSVGGGQVSVSGSVGEELNVVANLSKINASIINQFAKELQARGSVNGRVTASGSASSPNVAYNLKWNRAETAQTIDAGIGRLEVSADGTFKQNLLQVATTVTGAQQLRFNGSGSVAVRETPVLDLAFKGTVPFSLLASRLSESGLSLTGSANVNASVSGSAADPVINGLVTASNARFVHAKSGVAIEQIALRLELARKLITIKQMTGQLSTGGQLQVSGNVQSEAQTGFPADINVRILNGVYRDNTTVDTKLNANLNLTGPLAQTPLLSGTVNLQKTVITVPDRIPESISRLNVSHKNATSAVEQQAESLQPNQPGSSGGMRLDIQLNAENQIFIRGRGIDAEMGGALRILGDLENPRTIGGFDLRRGRLSILGKRLDFNSGAITFTGSLIPDLNMTAQTVSDDTTILITVTGPANLPQFRFSSSPALAEDEVFARLIFNRDVANLSPLQIVQLTQAIASLTGTGGNSSLLDRFQNLLPVDDLDVRTDGETGETTVGVGSYINDQTYVGVERGTSAGTGKATIDLSIGRNIKLRGEAGQGGENKAGIFYEQEY
ncbi:MAG: translocation/assembly module TamB domain-containing protein [Pseudomonadota bacterium]